MELNLKIRGSCSEREKTATIQRLSILGWKAVAWNTTIAGGLSKHNVAVSATTAKPAQVPSSQLATVLALRRLCTDLLATSTLPPAASTAASSGVSTLSLRGHSNHPGNTAASANLVELCAVEQLQRLTVVVDELVDAQSLTAGNEVLRGYDIVAARPSSAKTFAYLCSTAEIDLISIDFSKRLNFPMNKKMLDIAVSRGVFFEICYAPLLQDSNARREIVAGTRVLIQFLRGRNIILSSGGEKYSDFRGPFDAMNIGAVLNLNKEQSRAAIDGNGKRLLLHAAARRMRLIPVAVVGAEDLKTRFPEFYRGVEAQASKRRKIIGAAAATREGGRGEGGATALMGEVDNRSNNRSSKGEGMFSVQRTKNGDRVNGVLERSQNGVGSDRMDSPAGDVSSGYATNEDDVDAEEGEDREGDGEEYQNVEDRESAELDRRESREAKAHPGVPGSSSGQEKEEQSMQQLADKKRTKRQMQLLRKQQQQQQQQQDLPQLLAAKTASDASDLAVDVDDDEGFIRF